MKDITMLDRFYPFNILGALTESASFLNNIKKMMIYRPAQLLVGMKGNILKNKGGAMNTDVGVKTVVSWKGVGEYFWISFDMNSDEAEKNAAVMNDFAVAGGLASIVASAVPGGGTVAAAIVSLISQRIANYSGAIARANEGFGVKATLELPLPGLAVGIDRLIVRPKDGTVYQDFYEGTFNDLNVEVHDNPKGEPERDDGYRRLLVDLNKGAGGKFLYFILYPGDSDLITDIAAINSNKNDIPTPPGYTKIDVDLNKAAKGDFIYSYWKKDGGGPVKGIGVIASHDSGILPPAGYERINVDLNKNSKGLFIYLCFKK